MKHIYEGLVFIVVIYIDCINIVRKSKPWNKELRKLEEKINICNSSIKELLHT